VCQAKIRSEIYNFRKAAKDIEGHDCAILALAINSSGSIVASGDETGKIVLWSDSLKFLHKFMQHKNSITGLSFRRNAPELYSCSVDKTVKVRIYNFAELNFYLNFCQVWDTDSRSYIETLFGHQDTVHGIDANTRERAITAGGRDNTIRIFKIPEETQLVYRLSISQ